MAARPLASAGSRCQDFGAQGRCRIGTRNPDAPPSSLRSPVSLEALDQKKACRPRHLNGAVHHLPLPMSQEAMLLRRSRSRRRGRGLPENSAPPSGSCNSRNRRRDIPGRMVGRARVDGAVPAFLVSKKRHVLPKMRIGLAPHGIGLLAIHLGEFLAGRLEARGRSDRPGAARRAS